MKTSKKIKIERKIEKIYKKDEIIGGLNKK